ncbi:MAG: TetR/AcrR family transcriptional regulator [Myxococcota bacterium]|nr:TetR/AcrR family transcriptional regulator [Myxococcota bacterium]
MIARHNGRPSKVKGRILEEALRLFATRGFEGTSVQAVAEAVGIKNASLLYYFKSKEKLLDAVIDNLLDHWKIELPRHISESMITRDRFATLLEAVVAFFAEDQNRARFFIREALDRPREIGACIRDRLGPWIQLIADYIKTGKQSGFIKPAVDAEYYIFQIILIAAGSVALNSCVTKMLGTGGNSSVSIIDSLIRTARGLLMIDPDKLGSDRVK